MAEFRLDEVEVDRIARRVAELLAPQLAAAAAPRPEKRESPRRWLSRGQYADRYGVSKSTVDREIKAGRLEAKRVGSRVLVFDEGGES